MKLSCLPVSLFPDLISGKMKMAEWLAFAKECGYDGADISVHFLPIRSVRQIDDMKKVIDESGIRIEMMTTYPDFTTPDDIRREIELCHALSDIAMASSLGIRYVRLTAGQYYPGEDEYQAITNAVECFKVCCEKANKLGVKLLIENHSKPGAWEREDFDFNMRRFMALLDKLKGLPVGVNFDTANAFILGEDAVALFEKIYDRVETIHVNDASRVGELAFCMVGEGRSPIKGVLEAAKARGFNGLVSIEEASFRGKEGIAHAARYVRSLMG